MLHRTVISLRRRLAGASQGVVPRRLLMPVAATLLVCVLLIWAGWVLEPLLRDGDVHGFPSWLWVEEAETARMILLAALELLAGVFAISITVVAIIVQLSATRYTSRVVDLFLADRINALVLFTYVVPLIFGFWLSAAITPEDYSRLAMGAFIVLATLSVVVVIPYFNYVFFFLQPENIIDKIESSMEQSLRRALARPETIARGQREVSLSLQQLSDIALSSVAQADLALAMQSLRSMRTVALVYLEMKQRLDPSWFQLAEEQSVGFSAELRGVIVRDRTWVEMEIFKHHEMAFTSSLRKARDVNSCVATNLREMATTAGRQSDDGGLELMIKGLNTLVMYALSERDVRSAVHVFYQYRILAESLLDRPEIVEKIAEHFKYYALSAQRRRIHFILDAVAYDLRVLIEQAHDRSEASLERLLDTYLSLHREAREAADGGGLRGVLKSGAILGGLFHRHEERARAERIMAELKQDPPELLAGVRSELATATRQEFWEIEDRGVSFYYIDAIEREAVEAFFAEMLDRGGKPKVRAASS